MFLRANGLRGNMRVLSLIAGILFILYALLDAFQTIILPRSPSGALRLTSVFYQLTWTPWRFFACRISHLRKRETVLSVYGPLSLVLLIGIWALALILGFGMIYYALGSPFHDPLGRSVDSDFYVSGTTLFTLGLGDVIPDTWLVRFLMVLESGLGLGFVALVIGYFPVLYGAFSKREVNISMLGGRAGSPPAAVELLYRHNFENGLSVLLQLLAQWELCSAELLESHISYPLLCYFRSQNAQQSWLSSLVAILDACALLIAGVEEKQARQAQLTFMMARHALMDLSQIFVAHPEMKSPERLSAEDFQKVHARLTSAGFKVCDTEDTERRLKKLRGLYESYAYWMGEYFCMPLPPFLDEGNEASHWRSVSRVRAEAENRGGAENRAQREKRGEREGILGFEPRRTPEDPDHNF